MCKKMRVVLGEFRKWVLEHADGILFFGSALIVVGIVFSLGGCLWANLIILGGTFCLGLGFYLKGSCTPRQRLSEYGHFMLGLAALIALPQTPEILRDIMEVKEGVKALKSSQKDIRDILDRLVDEAGRNNQDSAIKSFSEAKTPLDQAEVITRLEQTDLSKLKPGSVYLSPNDAAAIKKELSPDVSFNQSGIKEQLRNKLTIKRVEDGNRKSRIGHVR